MNKILYILMASLALSCSKDGVDLNSYERSSSAIHFSLEEEIEDATRTEALKSSWTVGNRLAIFSDQSTESKGYKVSAITLGVATMTPIDDNDFFMGDNYANSTTSTLDFTAYYPYIEGYTQADYEAIVGSLNDHLVATISVSNRATKAIFTDFTHRLCNLSFEIAAGYQYVSGFSSIYAAIYDGDDLIYDFISEGLSGITPTISAYLPARDDLSNVTIELCANDNTERYTYAMSGVTTISSWEAGTPYIYTDVKIGHNPGSGTQDDPWMIFTAEDLKVLQSDTPKIHHGGVWSRDKSYKLADDISLEGESWDPISNTTPYFSGTFDGGGYTISGVNVSTSDADYYPSLFGVVDGATIKNLTLEGRFTGVDYVAAIASVSVFLSETTFTSCHCNNSTITCSGNYAGGIVAAANSATLNKCSNSSEVSGTSNTGRAIGGIAGSFNGQIINSYNTANIIGGLYVGGVVGYASGANAVIINCYNDGDIKTQDGEDDNTAGILGGSPYSLDIFGCYNSGNILDTQHYHNNLVYITSGGTISAIVGSRDEKFGYSGTLQHCYYLENTAQYPIYLFNSDTTGLTSKEELKGYATTLTSAAATYNESFASDDVTSIRACEWITGDGSDGSDGSNAPLGESGNYFPMLNFDTIAN